MRSRVSNTPVADWVDSGELFNDPYPSYQRLRDQTPVAWVPSLDRFLVTTFADCFAIEMDQETFSAREDPGRSTMLRTLGRPMLRKDDPEHRRDRVAYGQALRPAMIKKIWMQTFERNARRYIAHLHSVGSGADLFREFAIPYAADNLTALLGLQGVTADTMMHWSHTLIAGIGNVAGASDIWDCTARVNAEIDETIDSSREYLQRHPDASVLSAMVNAIDPVPDDAIRANIKLTISGGMNEPSHVITTGVWAMLTHPEQLAAVRREEYSYQDVFEESARYESPVGMYPRIATRDVVVRGTLIPTGSTVSIVVGSANRDPERFDHPDSFDISRERKTTLAFGNGTHLCLGNWAARAMVGAVGLPQIFDNFVDLRLADPEDVQFRGWVFRGAIALPVEWG